MPEIYFAQIREDGRAERTLSTISKAQRVACIGSGGCTALSLLDDRMCDVIVADTNPAQCALIELKMAALRDLDRDQFLGFIGDRSDTRRASTYRRLRLLLTSPARNFWDRRIDCITAGINKTGATERYYEFVGRSVRHSVISQDILEELFTVNCMERQHAILDEYFQSEKWNIAMQILLSKQSNLLFYPAFWYSRASEREFEQLLLPKIMQSLGSHLASENYFLSQLLLGRYLNPDQNGAPYYLSREGYTTAQRNLDKIRLFNQPIQTVIRNENRIDAFFLSNIFDWGKEIHAQEVWESVLNTATPQAVFLYRNMYRKSKRYLDDQGRIQINDRMSYDFQTQERSLLYRYVQTGTIH